MTSAEGGAGSATDTDGGDAGAQPGSDAKAKPDAKQSKAKDGSWRSGEPTWRDKAGVPGGAWSRADEGPLKGTVRAQWDAGQHWAAKGGASVAGYLPEKMTLARAATRGAFRAVPLLGSLLALSAAAQNLKSHDYIGAGLNVLSAVPGPIGWAGWAASYMYETVFHLGGTGNQWEPPDGVDTFMLPASCSDNAAALEVDRNLTDTQKRIFGYEDGPTGTVWGSRPPAAIRLDTSEVKNALRSWLKAAADQFQQLDTLMKACNEPYMAQWIPRLAPHFAAMAKLPDQARVIEASLDHASDAAGTWYEALTRANQSARKQLADRGTLNDDAQARALDDAEKSARTALDGAVTKLGQLTTGQVAPALAAPTRTLPTGLATPAPGAGAGLGSVGLGAPATPREQAPPGPAPVAPAPVSPAPVAPAPKSPDTVGDALSKLLTSLHPQAAPMPQMPMGGGLGGGMPMGGMPLGGGAPLGATPKPTPLTEPVKRDLAQERPKLSSAPADNKTADAAKKPDAAEAKRTETAAPGEKKPAAAPPPAPSAPVAAGPGHPASPSGGPGVKPAAAKPADTAVDVKGSKITFPDAKTAALAKELATGGPSHPVSLADAATKAGLVAPVAGQDPGQQIAPSDAKPGDLLRAGDKDYLVLEDGKFLDFGAGKVVDADQMPKDLGANGGYFHLRDAAGSDPSGAGPVSGPAPAVTTTTVADGPTVPTDGSSPAPVVGAPAAGAPGSSVPPSTGTPGVPEKGPAGAGPTNAAATDTGRGQGAAPVVGSKPLDPTSLTGNI